MTKKVFFVYGGADSEVGIAAVESKITIEDNYVDDDDEVQVQNWKDFLAEYYDVSETCVFTEHEWKCESEHKLTSAQEDLILERREE